MHKQHPQTAYRKYAVLIGTIFENCDKKDGQSERFGCPSFFAQKTAPNTVTSGWGGKNRILFFTGARSLPCRSYASGGARYLQPDLMLLTHARCALKDPHGCFGISIHTFVLSRTGHRHGMEIMDAKNRSVYGISACFSAGESTVSHCCVAQ